MSKCFIPPHKVYVKEDKGESESVMIHINDVNDMPVGDVVKVTRCKHCINFTPPSPPPKRKSPGVNYDEGYCCYYECGKLPEGFCDIGHTEN